MYGSAADGLLLLILDQPDVARKLLETPLVELHITAKKILTNFGAGVARAALDGTTSQELCAYMRGVRRTSRGHVIENESNNSVITRSSSFVISCHMSRKSSTSLHVSSGLFHCECDVDYQTGVLCECTATPQVPQFCYDLSALGFGLWLLRATRFRAGSRSVGRRVGGWTGRQAAFAAVAPVGGQLPVGKGWSDGRRQAGGVIL